MSVWSIVLIVGSIVVGVSSTIVFKLKQDNKIEELAEAVIERETGIDIDLSPGSEEKKEAEKENKKE